MIKKIQYEKKENNNSENKLEVIQGGDHDFSIEEAIKKIKLHFTGFLVSVIIIFVSIKVIGAGPGLPLPSLSGSISLLILLITVPAAIVLSLTTIVYLFKLFIIKKD